jgi:hypothetical protein
MRERSRTSAQVFASRGNAMETSKMQMPRSRLPVGWLLAGGLWLALAGPASAQVRASFLFKLSSFTGTVPFDWDTVFVDPASREAYVSSRANLSVKVFSDSGMEVFTFGENHELGSVVGGVVDQAGDILLLAYSEGSPSIVRCNYRGELQARFPIGDLMDGPAGFRPSSMLLRSGRLFLLDSGAMQVLVTTVDGKLVKVHDLAAIAGIPEEDRSSLEIGGLAVDARGHMFFTVPTLFTAYELSPAGKLAAFGTAGSAPGKFGVIGGIALDSRGNILIVDTLKSVVMVFDSSHEYQYQFGYRGPRPENLVVPKSLAIDRDRVYVTQGARRGVSVFQLAYE